MKSIPLGTITDIKTGKLDVNAGAADGKYPFFTCASTPYKINEYAFDTEAVLIAGNGDLNVKYYQGKFNAYQRTYVIQNKDRKNLSMKYLYYFIETYMDRLRRDAIGGIIKYIKLGHLTDAEVPLPRLDDQIRIAHLLGKVEGLITQRKQHLQQLDDLLKSVFLEMFGDPVQNEKRWKIDSLSSYGVFKNGLNFGRGESGATVRCLGVGDFKSKAILDDIDGLAFIELNELPTVDYFLQDGDLLFVRSNGNRELVGRCMAVYPGSEKVTYSGFCIRYRINDPALQATYLVHLFRSIAFRRVLFQGGQGANIQNINQQILAGLPIPVPAEGLQNQFALIVGKVDVIKSRYRKSLTDLEALYGALSQQAFKGELDLSRVPLINTLPVAEAKISFNIQTSAAPSAFPMPDLELLQAALIDRAQLTPLLHEWLELYRLRSDNESFSPEHFLSVAQNRLKELHPENDYPLGLEAYEIVKKWVFDALKKGLLQQSLNITGEDKGVPILGNKLILNSKA